MAEDKMYKLYDAFFPQMLATGAATVKDKAYFLKLGELCTKYGISFTKFYQLTMELATWQTQYTEETN